MDIQTAGRLIALWKSGEDKYRSFFKVLNDVRLEIGNEALPVWCRRELGISLEIILSAVKIFDRADVAIERANFAEARKLERNKKKTAIDAGVEIKRLRAEVERLNGLLSRQVERRVTLIARRYACEHCGQPLPPGRRTDAKYCSVRCRVAVHRACAPRS
jgi:hypothetical protein